MVRYCIYRCFAVAFLFFVPTAPSQEKPTQAGSAEAVRLEEFPGQLQKIDEEIALKIEEVRAQVDREAAAKNITEPIAQSLRWSLRTTALAGGAIDVRGIVSTMRVPTDNSALMQSVKELETAYAAAQAQQTLLASNLSREVKQRVIDAVRTAAKPQELDALETPLTKAGEALRRRTGLGSSEATQTISRAESVLRGLRRVLDAESGGKPETLGQALSRFRGESQYGDNVALETEIQARIEKAMQPVIAAAEKAEDDVLEALVQLKPRAEIDATLAKLGEAEARAIAMRRGSGTYGTYGLPDYRQMSPYYRTIAEMADALADGKDASIEGRLNAARTAARSLSGKRVTAIEPLLVKLEKDAKETAEKMAIERGEKLRARIADAKQPGDLDEILQDLRRWESRGHGGENWSQLAGQLGLLSAAWATNNPVLLAQDRYGNSERAGAKWAAELARLEKRVERDVLSRALAAPELSTSPLSEKPPEAALEALCDELAAKGEWRRLYDILSARLSIQMNAGRSAADDTVTALRAFFTAQNLELAEQWADAMRSYKSVLQSASTRAPIKPSAERIKVLAKEHPESLKTSASPTRGESPERPEQ